MGNIIPGAKQAMAASEKAVHEAEIAARVAEAGAEIDKEKARKNSAALLKRQRLGRTVLGGQSPTNVLGQKTELASG